MSINLKNLIIVVFSVVLFLSVSACKKVIIYPQEDFIIEFGSECGWCAGKEYITITSSRVEYERLIPCGDNKGTYKKSKSITTTKWDSIWSAVDFNILKTLDYDECNVCADGCDEILRITKYDETHQFRYSPEKEIEEIEELRQILVELLSEFNEQN